MKNKILKWGFKFNLFQLLLLNSVRVCMIYVIFDYLYRKLARKIKSCISKWKQECSFHVTVFYNSKLWRCFNFVDNLIPSNDIAKYFSDICLYILLRFYVECIELIKVQLNWNPYLCIEVKKCKILHHKDWQGVHWDITTKDSQVIHISFCTFYVMLR